MAKTVLRLVGVLSALLSAAAHGGVDETINAAFRPIAKAMSDFVFFSVQVGEAELQLIVVWLIAGALFFTCYFRFISIRGFRHAVRIVLGKEDKEPRAPGEVSHFQALATAVSGTVGVGNITHVAVAVSIGGPGAAFWLMVAGFLGMASKFVECTLGVKYRQINADGTVSGGPMFYLDQGLKGRNLPRLGKAMAWYYAICIMMGSIGVAAMFQANQAYVQFVNVTGGEDSFFDGRAWLFGTALAVLTRAGHHRRHPQHCQGDVQAGAVHGPALFDGGIGRAGDEFHQAALGYWRHHHGCLQPAGCHWRYCRRAHSGLSPRRVFQRGRYRFIRRGARGGANEGAIDARLCRDA